MAITLDNTVGGEMSNSYCDVDYCDEYWQNHYSSVKAALWTALSAPKKESLLVAACRVLEIVKCVDGGQNYQDYSLLYDRLTGTVMQMSENRESVRYYYHQALQFPRNRDRDTETGDVYIPEPVLMAQCEQAVYLLSFDETALATRLQGIGRDTVSVGGVTLTQEFARPGSTVSPMALEFLTPFILKRSASIRRG
jgi:hypothetical protein